MRISTLLFALLMGAIAAADPPRTIDVSADTVHDKIRGGLLGQILGDLNGLKHEMKYIAEPGNVERYTPALPEGAWTDDDTDIEWVYIVEMQQSRRLLLPPARIAALWKAHINRRIWCSHRYLRQLLDLGIEPPLTGRVQINPWADFNLSGQFAAESWGLISPGMPRTAARIGLHYTHVSIDGEPAQATQLFTAMIAAAFLTDDVGRVVEAGVAALDPRSQMRRAVADVIHWHQQNPGDWRATRRLIRDRYSLYGGSDVRDRNGVMLNGAATIAALLYGRRDFAETLRQAFNFGWDADNNAATAGTVIGVMRGERWIRGQGWEIQDRFRNTSRDGMPMDETITRFGDRLVALAERVIRENGGATLQSRGQTLYRIRVQEPANIEPLVDAATRNRELKAGLRAGIERGIVRGASNQERARAAYLAICLDQAPALKVRHPAQWEQAIVALSAYPKLMHVLFFDSPVPAGERLREKAIAAGLRPPAQRAQFQ